MHTRTVIVFLLSAIFPIAAALAFNGTGQVRTLYNRQPHDDLGCLTKDGKWTVDEPLCGVFTARRTGNYNDYTLSAEGAGACGLDHIYFVCGEDVAPYIFSTWGDNFPAAGLTVLRYGQYGVFATDAPDSPPAPGAEPLRIRLYSASDKGKWAWLGWNEL
ncbi:hypothetical protein VTJ83DRAFT_1371 [Remersonia thermophila]|uniref:RNase T2-like C-terminal domain-containing protein n=1 Tax=Remersonia thermophila TaxID=72144 RepID=A0ABR4DNT9_9PEZI